MPLHLQWRNWWGQHGPALASGRIVPWAQNNLTKNVRDWTLGAAPQRGGQERFLIFWTSGQWKLFLLYFALNCKTEDCSASEERKKTAIKLHCPN